MAVVDKRENDATAPTDLMLGQCFTLKQEISFAATNATAADIYQALDIPAGTKVLEVLVDVDTVEDSTCTIDVGDFDAEGTVVDADGWLDGIDVESLGWSSSKDIALTEGAPNTIAPAYFAGKCYDAAHIIGVTVNDNSDTGILTVEALCVKL